MVKVKQARNLVKTGFLGKADPYVKMALWHKDKLVSKAKTDTQKNTQDPVWNKTLFFDLPELDDDGGMRNIRMEFTVMDEDFGKDDVIGRLIIGGEDCAGTALEQWNQVLASPLDEFEAWHPLSESGIVATTKPIIRPDDDKVPPVIEADKKEDREAKEDKPSAVDKVSYFSVKFCEIIPYCISIS